MNYLDQTRVLSMYMSKIITNYSLLSEYEYSTQRGFFEYT